MQQRKRAKLEERIRRGMQEGKEVLVWDRLKNIEQDPLTHLPMEVKEPLWRSLFERPAVLDDKGPQPLRPPKWELMAPITAEDVDQFLKTMKDGAPGPDS